MLEPPRTSAVDRGGSSTSSNLHETHQHRCSALGRGGLSTANLLLQQPLIPKVRYGRMAKQSSGRLKNRRARERSVRVGCAYALARGGSRTANHIEPIYRVGSMRFDVLEPPAYTLHTQKVCRVLLH